MRRKGLTPLIKVIASYLIAGIIFAGILWSKGWSNLIAIGFSPVQIVMNGMAVIPFWISIFFTGNPFPNSFYPYALLAAFLFLTVIFIFWPKQKKK